MKRLQLFVFSCLFLTGSNFGIGAEEEAKILKAMPTEPSVKPEKARKALVYSHASGFKHSSIPTGVKALRIMSEKTGAFDATFTVKTDEFTPKGLAKYDMIILFHGSGPMGKVEFFIPILDTIKLPGGRPLCCNIFSTGYSGL